MKRSSAPVRSEDSAAEPAAAEMVRAAVQKYEGPLTVYAARLVGGDVDRARDIVQDTFLKLWTADLSRVNGHLAAWLYRVCRNRALDVCRKEDRMKLLQHEHLEAREAAAGGRKASDATPPVDSTAVMAALERLPARQQEIIRLKFQGGLSYQEIAEVCDITANHVGVLIHTSLKVIREHLKQTSEQSIRGVVGGPRATP